MTKTAAQTEATQETKETKSGPTLSTELVDQKTGEIYSSSLVLPEDILAGVDELGGDLGFSQKAADSMIPILSILQDNSAEVKKKHSKYVEGAEAGDLIIRSLQRVIKMGDNLPPLVVQPAGFDHVWVEWNGDPGEGMPVAQYPFDERPGDAVERVDPQSEDRTLWVMPNGNRLVDTRYHYANMIDAEGGTMAVVIPMGGTNHTASRSWTAQMNQHRIPGKNRKAPAFFRQYGIKTKFRQRGEQSWFNYSVSDLGWVTDEGLLRACLSLLQAVSTRQMVAETLVDETQVDAGDKAPI